MRHIGYYYSDNGLFYLFDTGMLGRNWVSNICYYDTFLEKYYSPNIKNIMTNGRDLNMGRISISNLQAEITATHSSFVLN